jgi:hypothetical protein
MRRMSMFLAIILLSLMAFVCGSARADDLLSTTAPAAMYVGSATAVRGWILSVYDMPYLRETIGKAPSYGVNHIQLSHDIVHHADQLLSDPQRRKDVRELLALGKSLGLEMFIWTHELRQVSRRFTVGVKNRADLDNEDLWKWLAERYVKLYELLPELDGVVVSLDETGPAAVTDDEGVISTMQRQMRVRKLAETLDEVHRARGKRVVVRDFGETLWARQGIKLAPKDVGAMTKVVFGDWQPYCEPSMTYGYYGDRPLWVEYDLCGEYMGESVIPWPDPEYVKSCWDEARSKTSPAGGVARIDRTELWRVKYRTLGTPNEINIEMFCRLMQDPNTNPDAVWKAWTVKTYGAAAAPHVEKALRRMAKATKILYWGERLGDYRIQQHSYIPAFKYALEHDRDYMQTCAIDAEMFLLKPDLLEQEMARRYDSALPMYRDAVKDLEPARQHLQSGVFADLEQRFEMGRSAAWAFKAVHAAFIRYRVVEFGLRHEKLYREAVLVHRAKIASDELLLEKIAADIEAKYGDKLDLASPKRIRAFAADLKTAYAVLFSNEHQK